MALAASMPLLVEVEDVGDPPVEDRDGRRPELGRALRPDLAWLIWPSIERGEIFFVSMSSSRADDLDQAAGVGVVVDGEGPLVAEAVAVGRRIRTQAEWKVDTHMRSARGTDQLRHPAAHLVGGLVGEGDGQDLPRGGVAGGDQVGDAPGEHAGLARAGPGHDEQRPPRWTTAAAWGAVRPSQGLVGGTRRHVPEGTVGGPAAAAQRRRGGRRAPPPGPEVTPTRWCRVAWT